MEAAIHLRTLMLSQAYEPVKVISWRRAVTLLSLGKVEIVEEHDCFVRSPTIVIKIPAVVRLLRAFKRFRKLVKFSRINIYARDNYTCQYCGAKKRIADLTYDHVTPRSQGGKTTWTNIVTSCAICNRQKGGRTPEQAGMTLRKKPVVPSWVPVVTISVNGDNTPDSWRDYLYWTTELQE
jgi:5-methylcytosine-specific restriction endonuclease McrA